MSCGSAILASSPMASCEPCTAISSSGEQRTVLTFADDGWLDDVVEAGQSLPPPLRVSVELGEDAEQSA
jgi:hypothetical protein